MIRLMGQSARFVSTSERVQMNGLFSSLMRRSNPEELLKNESLLQVYSVLSV